LLPQSIFRGLYFRTCVLAQLVTNDSKRLGARRVLQDTMMRNIHSLRLRTLHAGLLFVLTMLGAMSASATAKWLPAASEELQMQSEPQAPGAPAIVLYRQVDRDDSAGREDVYQRTKILTEEGRSFGDVEIEFTRGEDAIWDIEARVIHPDGRIVTFDGKIYEKPVPGSDAREKALTLPDVQVGCIVEYRYRRTFKDGWVYDSHWVLSHALFTRMAKFSLVPYPYLTLRWSWPHGLPEGAAPPKQEKSYGTIVLEAHDIAPFIREEFAPPDDQLTYRVDFVYTSEAKPLLDPKAFWENYGKKTFKSMEALMDAPRTMAQALAQIVAPEDSTETKLRKIYARVQQLHNVSFTLDTADRSEQEKHKRIDDFQDVGDIWKAGFAGDNQLSWLMAALVRAAGLHADLVLASTRDHAFFDDRTMDPDQLRVTLVHVQLEGRDVYLEPGQPSLAFGELMWTVTAVKALRLDANGGTWVNTPVPPSTQSRAERNAVLTLDESGTLTGTVTATFTGSEALWRRNRERYEDNAARKSFIEDDLRDDLGAGSQVSLTNEPDWAGAGTPLVAQFKIEVPGWTTAAGRRQLFPAGVLVPVGQKNSFKRARVRTYPLYFFYAYQDKDSISIDLPAGWSPEKIPQPSTLKNGGLSFNASVQTADHKLLLAREFSMDLLAVAPKYFDAVRGFFDSVRASDEQQVVFETQDASVHH
jgi:hypothetical protein